MVPLLRASLLSTAWAMRSTKPSRASLTCWRLAERRERWTQSLQGSGYACKVAALWIMFTHAQVWNGCIALMTVRSPFSARVYAVQVVMLDECDNDV